MFAIRKPSPAAIDRFLRESTDLPLSYGPIGLAEAVRTDLDLDEETFSIGRGPGDFDRARAALQSWRHFDLGWTDTYPAGARADVGTVVAVVIRHLGFWSLNGCRVVYHVGGDAARFGFAYGTLTNHAERGEEIFEVRHDAHTGEVTYRIRAVSSPRAALARAGRPIVRLLQARFRRESAAALTRAVREAGA